MSSSISLLQPTRNLDASSDPITPIGTTVGHPPPSTLIPGNVPTSTTHLNPNSVVNNFENRPTALMFNDFWGSSGTPYTDKNRTSSDPEIPIPLPYGFPPGGVIAAYGVGNLVYIPPPPPGKDPVTWFYQHANEGGSDNIRLTPAMYADYSKAPPVIQSLVQNGTITPATSSQQWFAAFTNMQRTSQPIPLSASPAAGIQGEYKPTGQTDNTGTPTYTQLSGVDPNTGKVTDLTKPSTPGTGTQDPNAAADFNSQEAQAYQKALTDLAAQATGVSLDTTQQQADRQSWLQSINSIQQLASGNFAANDPAAVALQQAGQNALRNLQAQTATAAASSSPNLAYNGLLNANGALQSQLAQAGALQRANEQLSAQQALPGLFSNLNTQDISTAATKAGLQLQGIQTAGSILTGSAGVGQNAANAAQLAATQAAQLELQLKALNLTQEQITNALTEYWANFNQHDQEFQEQIAAGNTAGVISGLTTFAAGLITAFGGPAAGAAAAGAGTAIGGQIGANGGSAGYSPPPITVSKSAVNAGTPVSTTVPAAASTIPRAPLLSAGTQAGSGGLSAGLLPTTIPGITTPTTIPNVNKTATGSTIGGF